MFANHQQPSIALVKVNHTKHTHTVNKRTSIAALWTVLIAVLFVLLSPLTPGAIAPHGGKLLKPNVVFALNTFIAKLLLIAFVVYAATSIWKYNDESSSALRLPISLRC